MKLWPVKSVCWETIERPLKEQFTWKLTIAVNVFTLRPFISSLDLEEHLSNGSEWVPSEWESD